jgi:hypothetical protein
LQTKGLKNIGKSLCRSRLALRVGRIVHGINDATQKMAHESSFGPPEC